MINERKVDEKELIETYKHKWSIGDKINFGMLVITGFLFVITSYSTCLTRQAIVSSDSTNREYLDKIQNLVKSFDTNTETGKESLSFAQKSFDTATTSNNRSFNLQYKSLNSQIVSLQQTQKDFEIENRPFLVFTDIILDTSFKNSVISITYKLNNNGKFPAKISCMASKINYGIDTTTSNLFINDQTWKVSAGKDYLPNNATLNGTATNTNTPEGERFFKNGAIHIFLYFNVRYYSSVLKTAYSNYTVWQITLVGKNIDVSAIENK